MKTQDIMKKMKRFTLLPQMNQLSESEQMILLGGGNTDPNVCHSKTSKYQCYGACVTFDNLRGRCYWIGVYSQCMCFTISK